MNAQSLLDNFHTIARAPGGVSRVRDLVYFFAITGGLSRPETGDSDAKLILDDSLQAKLDYYEENSVRQGARKHSEIIQAVKRVPSHWVMVTAGDLVHLINGRAFKAADWKKSGLPIIRIQNLNNPSASFNYFQGEVAEGHRVRTGDMLLSWSGTPGTSFGAFIWNGSDAVLNQHIFKVAIYSSKISKEYLRMAINASLDALIGSARGGVGLKHVTKGQIESLQIPLPPLEEQKRIVSKVDELMRLCDQLEAQQQVREKLLPLLSRVNHTRFVAEPTEANLRAVFPTERRSSPSCLRDTVLSLAVKGLLVRQDETDQPTDQLMSEIWSYIQVSDARRTSRLAKKVQNVETTPFPLPESWKWIRLGAISESIEYGTSHKADSNASNVPIYRMGDIQDGELRNDKLKYVPRELDDLPSLFLQPGDILFNRTNSADLVGKAAIFRGPPAKYTFASYLIRVRLLKEFVNPEYINLCFLSPYFRATQIAPELTQQCGQANFNGTKLANTLFPLPPKSEQMRIVLKVKSLLEIVFRLEAMHAKVKQVASDFATATVALFTGISNAETKQMKPPKTEVVTALKAGRKPKNAALAPLALLLEMVDSLPLANHDPTGEANREVTAKELWQASGLEIDAFYRQLKTEMANGWILEDLEKRAVQEVEAE